jgi:hypothetical protein
VLNRGLTSRDEALFLSAIDASDRGLVERQRGIFRNLQVLPLAAAGYSWTSRQVDPPGRPAKYPKGAVVAAVDLAYLLKGWDATTVNDSVPLTFAPVAGTWKVVGDTELGTLVEMGPFAEPWAAGKLLVATRPHVLVLGDADRKAAVERLASRLETLVADVRKIWPEPSWNGKVVAYAMTDKRFVKEWFGSQAADGKQDDPSGDASFVAKVTVLSGSSTGEVWTPAAPRLIVTPYLLGDRDAYSVSVLRHEVTHVATALVGRPIPVWLREGVAEYTGFRLGGARVDAFSSFRVHGLSESTAKAMKRGTWTPQLVNDASSFYGSDAETVENAYLDAWIACLYIADHYGDQALRRMYDTASAQPPGASLEEVEAATLKAVLKTDRATFQAAVRSYGTGLRRQFR